jgi:DNA-binding MarR family transcriptional regulator
MPRANRRALSSLLTDAQRWLEASERENAARGAPLARAHALVFSHLDATGTRPAEVARRAGISRQAVGQSVAQMRELGLVKLAPDPTNRRARLILPTVKGQRALERSSTGTGAAEKALSRRIGAARVKALREALETNWGEPV